MVGEGCKKNIQKLQLLLCVSQCIPLFFLIKVDQKLIYGKLSALKKRTREIISSWSWERWGSPLACLYDIVKPFSITFLCVVAVLFEHNGVFHLIWWWFKAFLHPTYNINHCSFSTGFTFKIRLLWFSLLLWLKVIYFGKWRGQLPKDNLLSFYLAVACQVQMMAFKNHYYSLSIV